MGKGLNAAQVLANINACIDELTAQEKIGANRNYNRYSHRGYDYTKGYGFKIRAVCDELSIFDWWNDTLSMSQLKQMRDFVKKAIELGFKGYVCFKVGAAGCAHGMWASTDESLDGYSPKTGDTLFHSFRAGDNYWSAEINGVWMNTECTLAEVKAELSKKEVKA